MSARKCCILLNTRAGALKATTGLEQLQELAREAGLDAEVIGTRTAEAMLQRIRSLVAQEAELVAVAGGDGTVSMAVQEMAYTRTVLGILPQGTFNNFASALHLPLDLPSALGVLAHGHVREVGLGKVCGRYFTEAAGVGLFADSLALYGPDANKRFLRGLYAMVRVLLSLRARRFRLVLDGKPRVERAVMCTVANSFRMSAAVPIAPEASLHDDELDVVTIGDLRPGELLPYYRAFRAQLHLDLPKVSSFRAREVRIESRRPMNVHCDDRVVGETPVTFTAHPRALKVMVGG